VFFISHILILLFVEMRGIIAINMFVQTKSGDIANSSLPPPIHEYFFFYLQKAFSIHFRNNGKVLSGFKYYILTLK